MSVLDSLRSLLGGGGKKTLPLVLAEGEVEITRTVASFRPGGLTSVGGDLVLTNKRLVFTPLDVTGVVGVLTWALGKVGAPDVLSGLPEKIGDRIRLEDLGAPPGVAAGGPPRPLMPPTILITGTNGAVSEIGVLAHRHSYNGSSANAVERDRMLAAIRAAMRL
ncbi:hypothetical protein [Lentzea kentuckyensis]|uniref:hypothetical protein n=1 Tax=Lentzea kentuckyensis TaxID=360086 RepID=UPI000A3D42D4|nr:hypothetical protein [Lentzea kentuckyensis]